MMESGIGNRRPGRRNVAALAQHFRSSQVTAVERIYTLPKISAELMPHGYCFLWRPEVLWLHVVSDALIALAYLLIPIALILFVRRRRDLVFQPVFLLFGAFILLCGGTHLFGIWTVWSPVYVSEGVVKAITGVVSLFTAYAVWRAVPLALALPSPAQLAQARDEAQAANKAKSLFLANMSHEIRTPMHAVLGYAQILQNDGSLRPGARRYVLGIRRAGEHLMGLINDILDFSKIEAQSMTLEPKNFDLNLCLEGVADMFRIRCAQKGLDWKLDAALPQPCVVQGDSKKINQILINLIGNSVKFTTRGGVCLRVRADGDDYSFYCIDTGPGISSEQLGSIFEPFRQSQAGIEQGGTGLGVSICKGYLDLMGSALHYDTLPGQGCTVSFSLHLPSAEQVSEPPARLDDEVLGLPDGLRLRALVADDVEHNREVLCEALRGIGVEVVLAANGEQALSLALQERPDIIFMDVRMPVMDGIEAFRRLSQSERSRNIPCVVVSASLLPSQTAHFLELGFHDHVAKPFRFNEIHACLERVLDIRLRRRTSVPTTGEAPRAGQRIVLPADDAARLRDAAARGALTTVRAIIAEFEASADPGLRAAAEALREKLAQFDFDAIAAFADTHAASD